MIVVFWLEAGCARSRPFTDDALMRALKHAEDLRIKRKSGEYISHVVIQSEMVESVGEAGVDDIKSDYGWYKRRPDPSIPVGRPSGKNVSDDIN